MTPEEIALRKTMFDALVARVQYSITGAADPRKAAEYVANGLTYHDPDLLAAVAVTFARQQVEAALAADTEPGQGT